MHKQLLIGLGIGLVFYPALEVLQGLPFVGRYMTLIAVVAGVVLILKGVLAR
ncbi:hypothetical protein GF351_00015 [Candidatus Woesearchaeota archaeon]|nr:hypothetical protein [Candidatus Woesearchaeota archaeon]